MTDAFKELMRMPNSVSEHSLSMQGQFMLLMYDNTRYTIEANKASNTSLHRIPRIRVPFLKRKLHSSCT